MTFVSGQINQYQSLFTYGRNESVVTFSNPDFEPMFADNITWNNASLEREAQEECGDDLECLFDVASTKDLSVGIVTKDISIQLVNESNTLGEHRRTVKRLIITISKFLNPFFFFFFYRGLPLNNGCARELESILSF